MNKKLIALISLVVMSLSSMSIARETFHEVQDQDQDQDQEYLIQDLNEPQSDNLKESFLTKNRIFTAAAFALVTISSVYLYSKISNGDMTTTSSELHSSTSSTDLFVHPLSNMNSAPIVTEPSSKIFSIQSLGAGTF